MKKKFLALLLAFVMVLSAGAAALAAEEETTANPSGISLTAERSGDSVRVQVYLTGTPNTKVTNGRVEVAFDASRLRLVHSQPVGTWITSVNTEKEGVVSLAWIGSEITAERECILTLYLEKLRAVAGDNNEEAFSATAKELYEEKESATEGQPPVQVPVKLENPTDENETVEVEDPIVAPVPKPVVPTQPSSTGSGGSAEVVLPFTDVAEHWALEYVKKVYAAGLMNGTGDTTFEPNTVMSRAMFVTLLWRQAGSPEPKAAAPFADVAAGSYYGNAVAWAFESGVVTGVSDTAFAPNQDVSRQEMVTMLQRYAKPAAADGAGMAAYPDASAVSAWAADAMAWAVDTGLINGLDGRLAPQANTTRAQAAAVFCRFAGL